MDRAWALQVDCGERAHVQIRETEAGLWTLMRDDGQHGDEVAGDQIYTTVVAGFALAPGEMVRYYVTANEDTAFGRMPRFLSADKSPQYFGDIRAEVAGLSKLPVFHRFIADPAAGDTSIGTRVSVF